MEVTVGEKQPLLESGDHSAESNGSNKHLGSGGQTTDDSTNNSSNTSLRIFQTRKSALPTIWKSPLTDSVLEVSIKRHDGHCPQHELSRFQFFMHIVRASIGTGVLSLPSAVANAGLLFGLVGIVLTALTIIHCSQMLVECAHFLRTRYNLHDVNLDYGYTVQYAFVFGTMSARKFRWASKVLNVCLSVTQFGICTVYIIFISENIRYVVDHYAPEFNQPLLVYGALTTVLVCPLIFIRSIRVLSHFSAVGNVFMVIGIVLIFIQCLQDIPPVGQYPLVTNFDRIPLFFGVAVFAFESINVVLPATNAVRDKDCVLGWNGLLNTSFHLVLLLYFAIAFFGFVKFGMNVEGSLAYAVPMDPWYSMIVKPIYAFLITLSFGLQYYVLYEICWQGFVAVTPSGLHKTWVDCLLRLFVLLAIFGVAVGIPYVEHVISLSGALSGSAICLIFPPMIYIVLFWDHSYKFRCFNIIVAKNLLIMAFGIFGAIIGSYTSIAAIIDAVQTNPK